MSQRNIALIFLYIGFVSISSFASQLITDQKGRTLGVKSYTSPTEKADLIQIPISGECRINDKLINKNTPEDRGV